MSFRTRPVHVAAILALLALAGGLFFGVPASADPPVTPDPQGEPRGGPCVAPNITGQPFPVMSLCPGMTLILSCFATGTDLERQWQKNGHDIPGQTSIYLSIGNVDQGDSGTYRCIVSNACGEQTSNPSSITVTDDQVPILTGVPASPQKACAGADLELSITFLGNPSSITWRRDGVVVSNQETLLLEDATPDDSGSYTVHIENMCGSSTSGPILVEVFPSGSPDFNGDGRVDGQDIQPMVDGLVAAGGGEGPSAAACAVDLNNDNEVDGHDVLVFLIALLGKD